MDRTHRPALRTAAYVKLSLPTTHSTRGFSIAEFRRWSMLLPSRELPRLRGAPRSAVLDGLRALRTAYALDGSREEWIGAPPPAAADESAPPDDAFESQYVRSWLSHVVKHACADGDEELADAAAALLVHLAGQSAGGTRACVYRFFLGPATDAARADAAVRIREIALTEDALGGRTWGAAPYLARRLMVQYCDAPPRRVLELGAGTGLVGLAFAQFFASRSGAPPHTVLTDHHAGVLANLAHNAAQSQLPDVHVAYLDWQAAFDGVTHDSSAQTLPRDNAQRVAQYAPVPADAQYDLLIAADCIYDPQHAPWIASVARRHLRRLPAPAGTAPALHLLLPVRPTHARELQSVYETFAAPSDLRIVSEQALDGTDNFGPAMLPASPLRTGSAVPYRHLIVAWHA